MTGATDEDPKLGPAHAAAGNLNREVPPAAAAPLRWWHGIENTLLVSVLAAMVVLPLAEIVLRKLFNVGIVGSSSFVQHFTLVVGMIGGAIAAREGRLLSLSSLTTSLSAGWRTFGEVMSHGVAAAISAVLCVASWQFARESSSGKILAYGVPILWLQLVMPLGFGLVALRLLWRASGQWHWRLVALGLAVGLVLLGVRPPVDPAKLLWPALAALAVATVFGAPLFTTLGGAAMILLWAAGRPIPTIPIEHYSLVTNPVLPSVPLFTLAGYFLAEGGASQRLVRVFQAWFGRLRGGPAIVTALVCAFFTSFTGASGVTILALGGLLLPVLRAANYSEKFSLGYLTGAGSLGVLLPPCLPLILYAVIAQQTMASLELPVGTTRPEITINQMFLGGLLPGVLLIGLTAWWGMRAGVARAEDRPPFDGAEARRALWAAKWELTLPLVTLGAMFSGLATPVEAAAVTALYALLTQTVIHRDLNWRRDVPRVMVECGLLIGGVLLILGVAMGLTYYLIYVEAPTHALDWAKRALHSKALFLLALNVFLLIVGCLMDIYSAIVVIVPLIVPMGLAFGIDPIHLGIVFLANLQLGFLTPPVGMNLFLASYRFGQPMSVVTRATMPMFALLLVGVIIITYAPFLSTWLPRLGK